jgi:hypothetical protein
VVIVTHLVPAALILVIDGSLFSTRVACGVTGVLRGTFGFKEKDCKLQAYTRAQVRDGRGGKQSWRTWCH